MMKRSIRYDKRGVSNALAYVLSFSIAAIVMTSSVIITRNIIEDKTAGVASLEAQSLANKIADSLVETVANMESRPDSGFDKILDVPTELAGRRYYIEVTESMVYVNTTDGAVSKSCTTYNIEDLNIGVSSDGKIYSGSGEIKLSFVKPDYVYKFDFGVGNSSYHSPIESGYHMVTEKTTTSLREPDWLGSPEDSDYHYRIPILVNNTSPDDLIDMPVKITLDPSNFDYSYANVTYPDGSSSRVFSDLVFVDSMSTATAGITITPTDWEIGWIYRDPSQTINVDINQLSDGYTFNDVDISDVAAFKLNDEVSGIEMLVTTEWPGGDVTGITIKFNGQEAMQSLEGDPPQGEYTISFSGPFYDGTCFYGSDVINIAGDIFFVDDDNCPGPGDGSPDNPFCKIQDAIDAASDDDTVFVYGGVYQDDPPMNEPTVEVDKRINLIGDNTYIPTIKGTTTGYTAVRVTPGGDRANIDTFKITGCCYQALWLTNCDDVTVENCKVYGNEANGIVIDGSAQGNVISNCSSHDNSNITGVKRASGLVIEDSDTAYNKIINCNFYNNTDDDADGIKISDGAHHNKIINCKIWGNTGDEGDGVEIIDGGSDFNEIINCTIWGHNVDASNDAIEFCKDDVFDDGPTNNKIVDCTIYDNYGGIYIYYSDYNEVLNCTLYNNRYGIYLYICDYNDFFNTTIRGSIGTTGDLGKGIRISDSVSNCNMIGCVIIDNENHGIHIEHIGGPYGPTKYNNVINCIIANNGAMGVYIHKSDDNLVEGCDIYGNADFGIAIKDIAVLGGGSSRDNVVNNCAIHENGDDGIKLTNLASNNTISNCDVYNNGDDGFEINGLAVNNIVENCDFFDHKNGGGGYIYGSHVILTDPINNEITGCNFYCNLVGIWMQGVGPWPANTNKNNIEDCNFYCNKDYGIYLAEYADNNKIYRNNFEDNGINNAYEESLAASNDYDYNNDGNWWDDFPDGPCGSDNDDYWIPHDCIEKDDYPRGPGYDKFSNREPDLIFVNANYADNEIDKYHVRTIQEGIDNITAGTSSNWGTVYVYNGTYSTTTNGEVFPIEINKNYLNIIGESRNGVIIKGDGVEDVINVTKKHVRIDSVTIKDGNRGINIYFSLPVAAPLYISFANCSIQYNNDGIYLDHSRLWGSLKPGIMNCEFQYNTNGIHLTGSGDLNIIANCVFHHNNDGIYIVGTALNKCIFCEIIDCDFYLNDNNGIYIEYGYKNEILNCAFFENNQDDSGGGSGIELKNSGSIPSTGNEIKNCKIYQNKEHGVYIHSDSNYNLITGCTISDNTDYGICIEGSSRNTIYQNVFVGNDQGNAFDDNQTLYGNSWNASYNTDTSVDNGNYWDDYDEAGEGAFDYYSGPNQDWQGGDGIVDDPHNITGGNNHDRYPLGGSKKIELRPYYINYWNPDGESIVYVKMSVNKKQCKYLYLHYGYDEGLLTGYREIHNHSMGDVLVFFDDFDGGSVSSSRWYIRGTPTVANGNVTFNPNDRIITKNDLIPSFETPNAPESSTLTNEVMYVVEARMKIKNSQANMILLSNSDSSNSYNVSVNQTQSNELLFHKNISGSPQLVKKVPLPYLNQWLRMKSYVYLGKTCIKPPAPYIPYYINATLIDSYLYEFDTFAFEGNISCLDTWYENGASGDPPYPNNEATERPYQMGKIGLGCPLQSEYGNGDVTVDWIKVMKEPIDPPTIGVGSIESINYGWSSAISSWNNPSSLDPYNPGPVLNDLNYGSNTVGAPAVFEIENLPPNTYTITVTIGGISNPGNHLWESMKIKLDSGETLLTFPGDETGGFQTKWATIDWSGGDLKLEFSGVGDLTWNGLGTSFQDPWIVNSMLIERGDKGGIKVTSG